MNIDAIDFQKQVKEAFEKIGLKPIFKGADVFNYKTLTLNLSDISTIEDLLIEAFKAGSKARISDIKSVLEIVDSKV
jgi:hypothetical protein